MSRDICYWLSANPKFLTFVPSEFKCLLCNGVMINPSYPPCGCEFCFKCICDYLETGKNKCPEGEGYDCLTHLIDINDIQLNPVTQKRILQMRVECTNEGCDYQDKISDVVRHLETCDKARICCHFTEYGCLADEMLELEMKAHLKDNQVEHLNMMTELAKGLKVEINQLRMEKVIQNDEISSLKEAKIRMESRLIDLENKIESKFEICKQDKTETNVFNEFKIEITKQMKDLENLTKSSQQKIVEVIRLHDIDENMACPFKWTIENFWKTKKETYAPIFYSNDVLGYKMRVGIDFINMGKDIRGVAQILIGENDGKLKWPCSKFIMMYIWKQQDSSCNNQYMKVNFVGKTANKPANTPNPTAHSDYIISLDKLKNESFTKNDKLVIMVHVI